MGISIATEQAVDVASKAATIERNESRMMVMIAKIEIPHESWRVYMCVCAKHDAQQKLLPNQIAAQTDVSSFLEGKVLAGQSIEKLADEPLCNAHTSTWQLQSGVLKADPDLPQHKHTLSRLLLQTL